MLDYLDMADMVVRTLVERRLPSETAYRREVFKGHTHIEQVANLARYLNESDMVAVVDLDVQSLHVWPVVHVYFRWYHVLMRVFTFRQEVVLQVGAVQPPLNFFPHGPVGLFKYGHAQRWQIDTSRHYIVPALRMVYEVVRDSPEEEGLLALYQLLARDIDEVKNLLKMLEGED